MKATKRLFTAVCVLAVLTAGGCTEQSGTENSTTSTASENIVSEGQESVSSSKEDADSSTKSEDETDTSDTNSADKLDWQFKEIKAPTFDNSEYKELKPYTSDSLKYVRVTTAKPSFAPNIEDIKAKMKTNSLLKDGKVFGETHHEARDYSDYGEECYPINYSNYDEYFLYIPNPDAETDERLNGTSYSTDLDMKLILSVYSDPNKFEAPNEYSLKLYQVEYTQDQTFEIVKNVYGEEIAQFLVYGEPEENRENDEDDPGVDYRGASVLTPDGNTTYRLSRKVQKTSELYDMTFSVSFFDKTMEDSVSSFDSYDKDYKSSMPSLDLSKLLESDIGSTNLNPASYDEHFAEKAVNFGSGMDTFERTRLTDVLLDETTYEDGDVYYDYTIKAYRVADFGYVLSDSGEIVIDIHAIKRSGKLEVTYLHLYFPGGMRFTEESEDFASNVKKYMDNTKAQAKYVLGLTDDEIKAGKENFGEIDNYSSDDTVDGININGKSIKVLGVDITPSISLYSVSQKNSGNAVYKSFIEVIYDQNKANE